MKKKIICLMMALGLVAALAACSSTDGEESKTPDNTPAPTESTDVSAAGFVFVTPEGKTVAMDEDMETVLADLGKEQGYFEAASCAFEGKDKQYTYSGFIITTRPDGEKDYVQSILLTDDSVATAEGIYLGSSAADVTAAYGEENGDNAAAMSYVKGNCTLNFIVTGDVVTSIEYLPAE